MSESVTAIVKALLAVIWLLAAACFFLPASGWATAGKLVFVCLLVSHAIECAVFWKTLRGTGRPMSTEILQTVLFGYVHYQAIQGQQSA